VPPGSNVTETCAPGRPWQLPGYQKLIALPEEAHRRLWGRPVYYRAFSRINGGPKVEDDLFAGIR